MRGKRLIVVALSGVLVVIVALGVVGTVFAPHLSKIEVTRAAPATLITLETSHTDGSRPTAVEFWDDRGFSLVVPATEVADGRVRVTVPPYIDPSTGTFGSAVVHVRVRQQSPFGRTVTNALELAIDALPTVGAAPGVVTLESLATVVALAPGVNFLLNEAHKVHPGWSMSGSAASIAAVAARAGDLRSAVLGVAAARVAAVDLGTVGGHALALTAAELPQLDRLMAAWITAIGPHSPSPCAAKDQYIAGLLHEQEFGEASTKLGSDFAGNVLTCTSTEVLEVAKRTTGWLGVLGLVAASGGIEPSIQVLATLAYVPIAAATTTLIATAQSIALTGGVKQDADNALEAIDLFQSTIVDALAEPVKAVMPRQGPLHDVYQAARTLEDELTGLLATAGGKPAPPPALTETPPEATTAQSALTTVPPAVSTPTPIVATAAPYVPTAAPFVPTAPPVALPIVSVTRVAYGPCTTPAPGGLIKGWINCPGTVYLQINRPLPSGDLRVGFDWPSLGSFFYGTAHVGSTTGPVDVHVVNTFINACVTTYLSTVQVYDGAVSGPLVARQQLTLTTTCQ